MFTTKQLQEEILRLKKENDICILAHAYQSQDILEVADYVGDSFGLSQKAKEAPQNTVLMCGVRFMAQTAKILCPNKKVLLSKSEAGCPMAEQLSPEELKRLKEENKDCAVVAYVNTTAELKTLCDVCVTSASALKIVKALPQKNILFIPDCNLGSWVKEQVPEKNFRFIKGGCPVHTRVNAEDVLEAKKLHPNALLLVHPECLKEVTDMSDYAGSTTGIMKYAQNSSATEFIIGTEISIVQHLQFAHPEKKFYPLSKKLVCEDMKLTTLMDVYNCVKGGGEEITLSEETQALALNSINAMLSYGG